MKKSNFCPKCNSKKIVKAYDKARFNNAISINSFKVATSTKYICCDCGYIEEYFDNLKDRNSIYAKFQGDNNE